MKIAFIGQKGIPTTFGGVEKHVEELSVRLAKDGHEVFVYTRRNYTPSNLKKFKGVNLISLPSIPTKHLDAISHTFFACLHVAFKRVDVVHFHSIGPSFLIWIVKILKPTTPVIATFHMKCYEHKKWGAFARACLKMGEWMVCKLPNKTITVSRLLKKYALTEYSTEARYIPNGVPIPKQKEALAIKKWGLEKDGYFVAISRLIRHKGIHYLIDAYKRLDTDKKLVIVGDGAYTDDYVSELKKMADGNENIIFTGNQTGRALNELFSNAYLFVQPSEAEGLSIALLEAMSYGLPVLVSDIPENLEAVGRIGISFKNKNIDDLAFELELAERNPNLMNLLGKKGIQRVDRFYNWENIKNDVFDVYMDANKESLLWQLATLRIK